MASCTVSAFHGEFELRQFGTDHVAVIPLDLGVTTVERATGAAALLQCLEDLLGSFDRKPRDHGHGFSLATALLDAKANDAISGLHGRARAVAALLRASTERAGRSLIAVPDDSHAYEPYLDRPRMRLYASFFATVRSAVESPGESIASRERFS